MLKVFTIMATAAIAAATLPTFASAQVQRDPMGDKSMGHAMSKPLMKKHKMMHHSIHRGMTTGGM